MDETTGRLPDQYIPQRIIDLQGDLEQAVTGASASATAASQSASQAQSSATAANSSAQAASTSSESAKTASNSATASKDAAAQSASQASASAQAAETSKTNAAASASAAKASETNAASSASAAASSETNAAASATAAQQAVDGFGLEVGTTTTGEPGTDAAVEIEKTGTKYTANFTIPRGEAGPAGVNENVPLGTASSMVAQALDAYPALPRKVQVHGRTIENLCPVFNHVNNGVTFSTDANGYISIKGTATDNIYEQPRIANMPQNTKVWIYVDSDFKAKGINNIYAQTSGWSSYAFPNRVSPSTTKSDTNGTMVISIDSGVTVDAKIRVMFVASETEPDTSLFVPSGVNTVEPTKLVTAGKNQWFDFLTDTYSNYGITVTSNGDGSYTINGENTRGSNVYISQRINTSNNLVPLSTVVASCWDNQGKNITSDIGDRLIVQATCFTNTGQKDITTGINTYGVVPQDYKSDRFQIVIKPGASFDNLVIYPQVEFGVSPTSWQAAIPKIETNLPSDINLANGDTLTIDRDGMTRILHAEGEPTVLENVTLPELPAPTFNVYTTGGYIQPTVDVGYEQDVNLVLQALEAKIAALEVNQTIMKQGA